ncbi:unnamed protein product [Chondrus crispus]|uniref:Uncharacterized protein n=1 Tax=Chondrus crispus TaxID=2769 RepID=R7QIK6_CHOCR|nr:unnamed protein product [Chondrus crispus]CDF37311.1 unnamed protein product [Chondrus crispus]|eukprot:XP_005717130.1 unnamed protein product [Chondrus crispus]
MGTDELPLLYGNLAPPSVASVLYMSVLELVNRHALEAAHVVLAHAWSAIASESAPQLRRTATSKAHKASNENAYDNQPVSPSHLLDAKNMRS